MRFCPESVKRRKERGSQVPEEPQNILEKSGMFFKKDRDNGKKRAERGSLVLIFCFGKGKRGLQINIFAL